MIKDLQSVSRRIRFDQLTGFTRLTDETGQYNLNQFVLHVAGSYDSIFESDDSESIHQAIKYLYWKKIKLNLSIYKVIESFQLSLIVQSKRSQNQKKISNLLDKFKDPMEDKFPED